MRSLATLLALLPTAALAHGGPAGHAHPHGAEGLLVLLAGLALAGLLVRRARR